MIQPFKRFRRPKIQPAYFEIKLDHDTIWIPAMGHTIQYAHAPGKVILCLNKPTRVSDVKLHLEGRCYINWDTQFPGEFHRHYKAAWKELPFHHDVWSFLRVSAGTSATILGPGNYEFPFEMCLPGRLPETIKGVEDSYIRYFLRAQVYGKAGQSAVTSREVSVRKVYHTPLRTNPSSVENNWPEKIKYNISIPTSTVPFGSKIRVSYRFVPLVKGIRLKSIRSDVVETHTVLKPSCVSRSRPVVIDEYQPLAWEDMDISTDDGCWYLCSRTIHLPKSTRQCLQSTATTVMHIKHSMQFLITMLNPDGHLSSVRLYLPIFLVFYPPSSTSLQVLSEIAADGLAESALPHYRDHVYDAKLVELPPDNRSIPIGPRSNEKPPEYSIYDDASGIPSYWDTC
ncbi:hypothetical protein BDV26DRAFT_278884 [Aspergillus bertholletiae]|uniref:Arrestin C-terminal-like domain-containing protein n=1 Tax=Aspergillus bertholletiae TaxID=1226010 RepID=A0A5N7BHR0_9EURO|nr:hypothetical protein BDV26DRAFT_278884 [Aspergillus bertholletiae]